MSGVSPSKPHLVIALLVAATLWTHGYSTDYKITARLDTDSQIIHGQETIYWKNTTSHEATELRFHLYFNAWRNDKSSFLSSNRVRSPDLSEWRDGDWAFNELDSLEIATSDSDEADPENWENLLGSVEFIQPNDGNPFDRTVVRVLLPKPVTPGGELLIQISFRTKVPRPFARTGVRGDYYFLAHWFPKLGVFEKDGSWNCHQFIQTEFYSDFGTYSVELIVPENWVVGATGTLLKEVPLGNGFTSFSFYQDRVHGFAWTTSPDFLEFERTFESPGLPSVEMRLLLMPDHLGQEDRYFKATEATLRLYGKWFGSYPYGHLTIVDPAYKSRSGGMEYPTIFTGGTRWLNPEDSGSPEGVTIHECGHQFWYGIIGNNEFEDAWLDEGFDTYSTRRVKEAEFSPTYRVRRYLDGLVPIIFRDLPNSPRSFSGLGGRFSELKLDVMSKPSWQYGPGSKQMEQGRSSRVYGAAAYSVNSYTKPAMMLLTLERYLGWETFQEVLSVYFEQFKFRHPKPADFFSVLNEVSGQDLSWFIDETFYSSDVFDYAVDSVSSSDELQSVIIRRWGEARFPVKTRIQFSDGEFVTEEWDGQDRWVRFQYRQPTPIIQVFVDPDEILTLDVNRTNNSWQKDAPSGFAASKWALKWLIWFQNVMEAFTFFG